MSDCVFCKIIKGEIPSKPVYQDSEVIVINDIHPAAPVHLLVIPKKHIADVMEADTAIALKLFTVIKKMINEKKIRNYRLVHNGEGAAYVGHMHIHILGSVAADRNL
jgi:histidine triad (HIT) family protein